MSARSTEIGSVIVALIACFGAVVSAIYTYTSRSRELDIELVKIGIGILRADPKEEQTISAREWAVQLIEKYSRQPFSVDAKKQLLNFRLEYQEAGVPDASYTTLREQLFPGGLGQADPEVVSYVRGLFGSKSVAFGVILVGSRFASLRKKIIACIDDRDAGQPCPPGSLQPFLPK